MILPGDFFAKYALFPQLELETISSFFTTKTIPRNSFLLRQGGICKDFVIVTTGCLRLYYVKDDVEVSVWFAFPGSSAIEISSYISGNPSDYFLQAIEESEVLVLSKQQLDKLSHEYPRLQLVMKNFWEDVVINLINRFTSLQKDSAEMRYLALVNNREYLDRIPQKYLASYIGITPTSLSRIRKQLLKSH